jgi:hypothetical protein
MGYFVKLDNYLCFSMALNAKNNEGYLFIRLAYNENDYATKFNIGFSTEAIMDDHILVEGEKYPFLQKVHTTTNTLITAYINAQEQYGAHQIFSFTLQNHNDNFQS